MTHLLKRLNRKAIGYETIDRHIGISWKAKCRKRGKDKLEFEFVQRVLILLLTCFNCQDFENYNGALAMADDFMIVLGIRRRGHALILTSSTGVLHFLTRILHGNCY